MAGSKRKFYEVTINGRRYARFDKLAHAQAFVDAACDPDKTEIETVLRARL